MKSIVQCFDEILKTIIIKNKKITKLIKVIYEGLRVIIMADHFSTHLNHKYKI